MEKIYRNERKLMQTGCFKTRVDIINYLLIKIMSEKGIPLGSWILKEEMQEYGVISSTATIGRYLKELDYKEFTVQKGNQGRVPTPAGMAWLTEIEDNLKRATMRNQVAQSMKITEYDELIDLISTRKILEKEAARLAAVNATDEELKDLRRSVDIHQKCVLENKDPTDPALDFHMLLAKISHSKFISALLSLLIFEEKRIESVFHTLVTRERGSIYVQEHDKITKAIEERNAKTAAKLMENHIQELYLAIKEQSEDRNDMI